MDLLANLQGGVFLLLGLGALCLTGFAAFDALRRKGSLFPHVGRLTKPVWLGILIAAFLISIVSLGSAATIGLLNVIGVVAAGIYLAEVRPKLRQISGGGGGPYGSY